MDMAEIYRQLKGDDDSDRGPFIVCPIDWDEDRIVWEEARVLLGDDDAE